MAREDYEGGGRRFRVNVPPRFNVQGRRQLWFVERTRADDFINGLLTALLVFAPVIAALSAGGLL